MNKNLPKAGQKHIFKILCPFCFILNKFLFFFNLKNLGQKWAKNGPKMGAKWAKKRIFSLFCPLFFHFEKKIKKSEISFSSFFWLEITSKNGTSHLHTMFGSRDMHFMSFLGQNGPKTPKKGQNFGTFFFIIFLARNYLKKLIQWAQTAKNGFKCIKMHSNTYSPKRAKKW